MKALRFILTLPMTLPLIAAANLLSPRSRAGQRLKIAALLISGVGLDL